MKKFFFFFLFLVIASCDSPLINHSNGGDAGIFTPLSPEKPAAYFQSENLYVFTNWLSGPRLSENNLIIELSSSDSKGTPVNPEGIFYPCLWMGIHGHGSLPVKLIQLSEGKYKLENFMFIMPGPWELRLYLLDSLPPYEGLCDPEVETEFDPSTIIELQEIKLEI